MTPPKRLIAVTSLLVAKCDADGIGFWVAAILLSTGFGALHYFLKPNERWEVSHPPLCSDYLVALRCAEPAHWPLSSGFMLLLILQPLRMVGTKRRRVCSRPPS
jgi:hypothetical protein